MRLTYRPAHFGLRQHRGARGLQTAQHGLCDRVSFDHVFENLHRTTAGAVSGVNTVYLITLVNTGVAPFVTFT